MNLQNFSSSKLNELKSRGVKEILIACIDELTGFSNAIYPQTQIQQCLIHQIRSSTQFVSYNLIADPKLVYKTTIEKSTPLNLELFDEKWGKKYSKIALS